MSTISAMMKIAGGFAGTALVAAATNRIADRVAATTLDKAVNTIHGAMQAGGPQSYVRSAAAVRVEPFVMMDSSFVELPNAKDVVVLAQRFITCYYLLAQASDNTIHGATVGQRMSKYSPDRDLVSASRDFMRNRTTYTPESYEHGLPSHNMPYGYAKFGSLLPKEQVLSLESKGRSAFLESEFVDSALKRQSPYVGNVSTSDVEKTIAESVNLAIGQIVNVEIKHGKETITTPVSIRLRPMVVPSEAIKATFSLQGKSYTLPARLQQKRVGAIDWKDLVFQTDRVREYREIATKDQSGFFKNTHKRANKNFIATMLSGKASVGEMSSAIITTSDTVRDFERTSGLLLTDYKTRQRILEDTMAMTILVVDADYETVTVYLDTIPDNNATYKLSDIKSGGKNDGNDLTHLMSSLLEGRIPGRL